MDFTKHTWPGLPNPVYLPTALKVSIRIIPKSVAGWTSGQYINPKNFTSVTFHDTGNMGSSALGEYNWAASGGRAAIGSAGSYNGIVDHRELIITQRFDELVGHAANHRGNTTSYAFEQAGIGIDFDKSLDNAMWVHAGVLQSMGLTAKKALYQHNYWSGKNCPEQVRKRGLWSFVEDTVDERIDLINAFLAGEGPDKPVYDKRDPIPELASLPEYIRLANGSQLFRVDLTVEAVVDAKRRKWASDGSPLIEVDIPKGMRFAVIYLIINADGSLYWYTPWATRVKFNETKVV